MKTIADKEIKSLWQSNLKQRAFQLLVKHHSPILYRQIRRFILFHDQADDILQETLIKVWKSLDAFRWESQLSSWLYRIAANECLKHAQKQKKNSAVSAEEKVMSQLQADPYFDGDEALQKLYSAISSLPEKQRLVFNMKYFKEMTYEEMVDVLGGTVGSLKASFHHARNKIEEKISLGD